MKLSGVTVVDFSQFMAGPMTTAMLADHGARVIKIEPPGGDPTRHGPRSRPGQATGDSFQVLNRGKLSVVLDLKAPADQEAALDLIAEADVVVESFRPGVAERLGVGYAAARARNPDLVYCSLSAFGQTGALKDLAAHDTVVQGLAGAFAYDAEGRPTPPSVSLAGVAAALFAMSAILMGLLSARAGNGGEHIDISMHDAALAVRGGMTAAALAAREDPRAFRPEIGLALTETYRTLDGGWLCLGAREPRTIVALLKLLGMAELVEIADKPPGRDQAALRAALTATIASDTLDNWMEHLAPLAGAVGPVLTYAEALAHPHTESRGIILTDEDGAPHLNTPIRFAREPSTPNLRVATLGQDGDAVPGRSPSGAPSEG
ncbi:CaiB/BaiF CoA-transferase family protein [Caulobacter sp. S45]|uniref:CaiB/BaiF CoA transferase family protein n=1 Tax=Caulobacter sp. S45 TaxID=1641861 RepID=UPI00131DD49A|nr:CaiB/BaiF CoA-transferase family protein [Caulobacter sp. S45]